MNPFVRVQIIRAVRNGLRRAEVRVPAGTSLYETALQSGLLSVMQDDPSTVQLGVYGQRYPHDRPVQDGDRIEIYRALQADPKEVRRFKAGRKARKAG